ncbi:MAG: hypothetical protein P8Z39_06450 [Gammaproteobacteria bacterium]
MWIEWELTNANGVLLWGGVIGWICSDLIGAWLMDTGLTAVSWDESGASSAMLLGADSPISLLGICVVIKALNIPLPASYQ